MLKIKIYQKVPYIWSGDPAVSGENSINEIIEYRNNFFKEDVKPLKLKENEQPTIIYLKALSAQQKDQHENFLVNKQDVRAKRFVLKYGIDSIENAFDEKGKPLNFILQEQAFGSGLKDKDVDFFSFFPDLRDSLVSAILLM